MTGPTLKKWLKNAPSNTAAPSPEESALHSPLGQLLRVYMFAALNLSTVNESYEKAITLREKDLFHQILVADEDAVQQDPFLSDADCVKVQHYLSLTGDMGGLP